MRPDGVAPGTVLFAASGSRRWCPSGWRCRTWSTSAIWWSRPGSSTATSTSTSPAAPSGRASTPRRAPRPRAASRRSSTCRSTASRSPPRAPRSRPSSRAATASCCVDVGFWGGVVPGNAARAGAAWRAAGVLGCKAFLVHSGIDEFPQRRPSATCARRCRSCATTGCRCSRTPSSISGAPPARSGDPRVVPRLPARRGRAAWEDAAIALLIALCRETALRRAHRAPVVRVVAADAARAPRPRACRSPPRPARTTCASPPRRSPTAPPQFKCAPPIREHENREALWRGAARRRDRLRRHRPQPVHARRSSCPSAATSTAAWGGIASLQLGLPAVWTEARRRGARPRRSSRAG